jgi:hypothetical protein
VSAATYQPTVGASDPGTAPGGRRRLRWPIVVVLLVLAAAVTAITVAGVFRSRAPARVARLGQLGVVVDDERPQVPGMLRRTVSPRFGWLSAGC